MNKTKTTTLAILLVLVLAITLSISALPAQAIVVLMSISVGAQSPSPAIFAGDSAQFTVTTTFWEGSPPDYPSPLSPSITSWSPSMPSGVTVSFTPSTISWSGAPGYSYSYTDLTITTSQYAAPGTYTFNVHAHNYMGQADATGTLVVIRPRMRGGLWETADDLMAGKNTAAGQLLMYDTDQYLVVNFWAKPNWRITETHLAVATSLAGIPQTKKGNPIPGQFQYKNDTLDSVESCEFKIPMTWASGTTLYIAAHCVFEGVGEFSGRTESAWAGSLMFPGRNWANYTLYLTDYPPLGPPVGYS